VNKKMGRYYSGDIEGKFWFGVQSSDDASFFGGEEIEPNTISYYFDKDDLPEIEEGIAECKKELGENKEKLDKFFGKVESYTDEKVAEELGIKKDEVGTVMEWYARLELGKKILRCVKKNGECSFEAEL